MLNQIQQLPDWQTLTAEQIRDALAAKTYEVRDQTPLTMGEILSTLGMADGGLVSGTVRAVAVENPIIDDARMGLNTAGVMLHTPERQGMIDMLAVVGEWPDELRDAVKALRVRMESQWFGFGGDGEVPSVDAISDAVTEYKDTEARQAALNTLQSVGNDKRAELAQHIEAAKLILSETAIDQLERVLEEQLETL